MKNVSRGRSRRGIALAISLLLASGCDEGGIRQYRVPKEAPAPAHREAKHPVPPRHEHEGRARRMLAAIVPHGDRAWFFKVLGPQAEVEAIEKAVADLLASVQFGEGEKASWTLPAGWRQEPGSGMRFATLRLGAAEDALEFTVIPLAREAGAVLPNVNRWRDQLGLATITEAELPDLTRTISVGGETGTWVAFSAGSAAPEAGPEHPAGPDSAPKSSPEHPAGPTAGGGFAGVAPEGWRPVAITDGMKVAAFEISEGERKADVSVMPLPGAAGGLLANVNRWRSQVGLEPASEADPAHGVGTIEVAGAPAAYVDLAGAEKRILGAILVRGDTTWFFKMQGPPELVGKQKAAFEAFVRGAKLEAK